MSVTNSKRLRELSAVEGTIAGQPRLGEVCHDYLQEVFRLSQQRQPHNLQVEKKRALGAYPSQRSFHNPIQVWIL